MRTLIVAWIAVGIVVGLQSPLAAQGPHRVSAARLDRQRQVQEDARDIARNLVRDVLDAQLQQFRDNNLTSHPWYGEIRSMRNHLDEMVNKQMQEVVGILEEALKKSDSNDAQHVKAFQAARNKSREILVRIQVEQQILLRRLKIAELARQIQQLIEHQTKVHKETESLPNEAADRRHELNLAALEDQRDVGASFGLFRKNLRETSHFSGEVGKEAAEAMRMVEKQEVEQLLGKAEKGLRAGDFTTAAGSQKDVIDALEALLQKIRQLQKTMDADSLEQKIAEALKKEEEIREASAKKPLDPDVADKLAAEQDKLAKKIDEISASAKPEVRAALEHAKQEAQEAANNLLEQKQPEALAHEDKAALDLKAAAREAEKSHSSSETRQPQTAEDSKRQELENKIDRLSAAADKLEKAAEAEREIAKDANQAAEKQGLKSEQAADLEKKNEDATDDAKSAEKDVSDSVPKAGEEVKQALEDMKQEGGDLQKAKQAKSDDASKSNETAKPDDAKKGEKSPSESEPKTNEPQQDDHPKGDKAEDADKSHEQGKPENSQQSQAVKSEQAHQAKETAQDAGKHADEAAKNLEEAAKEVRKEAQKAADELVKLSQEESDKLASLQQKVDKELSKAMDPTTDRASALAQAQKMVEEALQHQTEADQAAEKDKAGDKKPSNNPSDPSNPSDGSKKPNGEKPEGDPQATDKPTGEKPSGDEKSEPQAQVSEASKQAAELAEAGAPKAAETLTKAAGLSDQAQKDSSHGPPQKAAEDRSATRQALEEAKKELGEAIKQLSSAATKQFGEEAKESGELATEAKPLDAEAAKDLDDAQQQAQQPANNPAETPSEMQAAQNGVRQALAMASAELAARQQQIAAEQAHSQARAQGKPEAGQEQSQEMAQNSEPASHGHRSFQGAKKEGPGGPTTASHAPSDGQDLRKEPWFANLPPEARDTMRSSAQRRPPSGYERRTQEYFQNLDK
jgi:hypothetical protein